VAQGSIPFPRDPAGRKVLTLIKESYIQLRNNTQQENIIMFVCCKKISTYYIKKESRKLRRKVAVLVHEYHIFISKQYAAGLNIRKIQCMECLPDPTL
jgi:hypothetical protein